MRVIAKGRTQAECQKDVALKEKRGWQPLSEIKMDDTWIPARYVCVMEKPDDPRGQKNKFNQYLGY
ncbi:MAG: hypothetical protein Q8898_08250 [Bacillota bacterium]|nr:hypothetical protein [Bacillota bacterium]